MQNLLQKTLYTNKGNAKLNEMCLTSASEGLTLPFEDKRCEDTADRSGNNLSLAICRNTHRKQENKSIAQETQIF